MEDSHSLVNGGACDAGESWTVSYDGEVYWDACKMEGDWYYRGSFKGGFRHFDRQEKVTPICKNLSDHTVSPVVPGRKANGTNSHDPTPDVNGRSWNDGAGR
jgi:hypothetical protein